MKVKLQDLSKKFGQNYAVKNLNLSIEESKTIGLFSTVHEKKNNNNIKYFMCLI